MDQHKTRRDSSVTGASRRDFLQSSTTAAVGTALGSTITAPAVLSAVPSTQTLRVGLIGCGGRGAGAALNALAADEDVALTAMADLFENNLQASLTQLQTHAGEKVRVDPERCYLGFDAYQRLLESDVDVVILATPPAFRAQQYAAAVDAGKHCFVEITAAIDAPGVRTALAASDKAEEQGLSVVSGFCWRYHPGLRAFKEQLSGGAIGDIRAVYATYYRNSLGHKYYGERTPEMSDLEWQIRDWYPYLWLSGDLTILLSGGHSLDKMAWWLDDEMPESAVAVGSQQFPSDGNTYDNVFVVYEYAGGVRGFLGSRSQDGCYLENADLVIGSTGVGRFDGRVPVIEGAAEWRAKRDGRSMYQVEHDELFASIRSGRPINDGHRMAHTTLMGVMGRMAAYTGKQVTWEQALNSEQQLVPESLDWNTTVEQLPLAKPGLTELT